MASFILNAAAFAGHAFAKQTGPCASLKREYLRDIPTRMTLPDIPISVAFWAGIATLGSAAGAWFIFVATAYNSRRDTYEGIRNLLVGLKVELDFIRQWASGDEGDPGYVLPTDMAELTKAKPDWFNPSRYIFTFESLALQRFTAITLCSSSEFRCATSRQTQLLISSTPRSAR